MFSVTLFTSNSCSTVRAVLHSVNQSVWLQIVIFTLSTPVSVNVFDYVSSIVSYSLIGIAIFSGKYDSLSTSDLSVVISQVSSE